MAQRTWRPWLLACGLMALAIPAASVHAKGDAPPGLGVCVTRALRIGAAEVNGFTRRCQDVPRADAAPPELVLQTPPADGVPVSYTPLADDAAPANYTPQPDDALPAGHASQPADDAPIADAAVSADDQDSAAP